MKIFDFNFTAPLQTSKTRRNHGSENNPQKGTPLLKSSLLKYILRPFSYPSAAPLSVQDNKIKGRTPGIPMCVLRYMKEQERKNGY